MNKKHISTIALCIFAVGMLVAPQRIEAATTTSAGVYFSPASVAIDVGSSFEVKVLASSPEQAINAVSAGIGFDQDMLRVISVRRDNSRIQAWIDQPTFSNKTGQVTMSGVIFNPGFHGDSAEVVAVRFVAVGVGTTAIDIDQVRILANDGRGTAVPVDTSAAVRVVVSPQSSIPASPSVATDATIAGVGGGGNQDDDVTDLMYDIKLLIFAFAFVGLLAVSIALYNAFKIRRLENIGGPHSLSPADMEMIRKLKKDLAKLEDSVDR